MTEMRCPSCSAIERGECGDGEALFAAKARLRAALGEKCPRGGHATEARCPMRGVNQNLTLGPLGR